MYFCSYINRFASDTPLGWRFKLGINSKAYWYIRIKLKAKRKYFIPVSFFDFSSKTTKSSTFKVDS